jgi:hypothetical protein
LESGSGEGGSKRTGHDMQEGAGQRQARGRRARGRRKGFSCVLARQGIRRAHLTAVRYGAFSPFPCALVLGDA